MNKLHLAKTMPKSPKANRIFIVYNVISAISYSIALILLVAWGPYLEQASSASSLPLAQLQLVLLPTLATMLFAGAAGGTLCNLRGIFKYNAQTGEFPPRFEVPFYIRPFMGAATGLFTFFLGSLITSSLSDASTQSWVSLAGRLPYIAVALLAGFGSQEFMERLKEIARTTFSEAPVPTAQKVEIARWTKSDNKVKGPADLTPASVDELILLHGDIKGDGKFYWRIFRPAENIYVPSGTSTAVKIFGGSTDDERQTLAEETVKLVANQGGFTDWPSLEDTNWHPNGATDSK